VTALEVILTGDEQRRAARRYTDVLEAYDLFLRGRNYLFAGRETGVFMRGTREAHLQARELFERAIGLDPKFAAAYAEKSVTYFFNFIMPLSREPELLGPALEAAQRLWPSMTPAARPRSAELGLSGKTGPRGAIAEEAGHRPRSQ
jgi:adenylate cyclase